MKNCFLTYIKNRFQPIFFIPVILIFYLNFYLFSEIYGENITLSLKTLFGFIIAFLVFFHIRILDDMKDAKQNDSYKKNKLKKYLIITLFLELITGIFLGINSFLFYLIIILFSFGIFYDFSIKKILTKNILLNNFTHQILIILLGIYIFTINHNDILKLDHTYLIFTFNMYIVFALFEFARKIKKEGSKDYEKSYTYLFGRTRFTILITILLLITGLLTIFSLNNITDTMIFQSILLIILTLTTISSIIYAKKYVKEKTLKKIYFLYLFLTLLFIILANIIYKNIIFKTDVLVII